MTFEAVEDGFQARVAEIELFLARLKEADQALVEGHVLGSNRATIPDASQDEWVRILKGTVYVLLYSLVEAHTRQGFLALFAKIKSESVLPSAASKRFVSQWFHQRLRRDVKAFSGTPVQYVENAILALQDVREGKPLDLRPSELPFSGNLDREVIEGVLKLFDIQVVASQREESRDALRTVKIERNHLSHGDRSFAEVGRDRSVADLESMKQEVVGYLSQVLTAM